MEQTKTTPYKGWECAWHPVYAGTTLRRGDPPYTSGICADCKVAFEAEREIAHRAHEGRSAWVARLQDTAPPGGRE